MKFFKKLSLQHLTHDQLTTLLVLTAGAALLVVIALSLDQRSSLAYDNSLIDEALSNPTSLGAGMAWAVTYRLQPSWSDADNASAAQNGGTNADGWPAPRGCRISETSEDVCVKSGPATYRVFGLFAIYEKNNAVNGKRAYFSAVGQGNRHEIPDWNNSWTPTVSEPGNPINIGPNSSIELQWICQDKQKNYFRDEKGLFGVAKGTVSHTMMFFNGSNRGGFKGDVTLTAAQIPYGITNYSMRCLAASGQHGPQLNILVNRPLPVVNGSCGATQNACGAGTLNNTTDSSTNYLWQCVGANGGSTASCALPISVAPVATRTLVVKTSGTTANVSITGNPTIYGGTANTTGYSKTGIVNGTSITLTAPHFWSKLVFLMDRLHQHQCHCSHLYRIYDRKQSGHRQLRGCSTCSHAHPCRKNLWHYCQCQHYGQSDNLWRHC